MAEEFLNYNGQPLVRKGNIIYYGDTSEKYIIRFTLNDVKTTKSTDFSGKVTVDLIYSDMENHKDDLVKKTTTRTGFKDAMDFAEIWRERYNKTE